MDDYSIYPLNQMQPTDQDHYSTHTSSILAFILSPQIESWMDVVNPFILKNKIGMVKFVDELCNIELVDPEVVDNSIKDCNNNGSSNNGCKNGSTSTAPGDFVGQPLEPAHDLAIIHRICENHRQELEQQASVSPAARKLVTTLNILTQHRQYYQNLRRKVQQQSPDSSLP